MEKKTLKTIKHSNSSFSHEEYISFIPICGEISDQNIMELKKTRKFSALKIMKKKNLKSCKQNSHKKSTFSSNIISTPQSMSKFSEKTLVKIRENKVFGVKSFIRNPRFYQKALPHFAISGNLAIKSSIINGSLHSKLSEQDIDSIVRNSLQENSSSNRGMSSLHSFKFTYENIEEFLSDEKKEKLLTKFICNRSNQNDLKKAVEVVAESVN